MGNPPLSDSVADLNAQSLTTLVRSLQYSRGQFSLILVRCNYASLRSRIMQQLRDRSLERITTVTLPENAKTLLTSIRSAFKGNGTADGIELNQLVNETDQTPDLFLTKPEALMVLGLESVQALDQLFNSTNQVREEFRKRFPFPVVLWVNDAVLYKLIQQAPDFKNWASVPIRFEMARADLLRFLKNHSDRLFATILDAGDEQSLTPWAIAPSVNLLRLPELEFALNDITNASAAIAPSLAANLNFLRGQLAHSHGQLETAQTCYERSLTYWLKVTEQETQTSRESAAAQAISLPPLPAPQIPPHPSALERAACVYFYLGLAWRAHAVLNRAERIPAYRQTENYFRQSLDLFERENRQDLVARFVIARMEVLQKLANAEKTLQPLWWQELAAIATNAVKLHHLYIDPIRQARDHGFLAEVALFERHWAQAKHHAEAALRILQKIEGDSATYDILHPSLEVSLDIANTYHRGWYLYLLARAEKELGHPDAAITQLETASRQIYPQRDPSLYIRILDTLRNFYYQQNRYLDAFRIKQYQRTIERQFGFRAFVGALRLQPQAIAGLPISFDPHQLLAQEIAASGRQHDVDRLIGRLGRDDIKLTVIHGPSGVGKSSILNAGLIPALKEKLIGDRTALPLLIDRYTDWQTQLSKILQPQPPRSPIGTPPGTSTSRAEVDELNQSALGSPIPPPPSPVDFMPAVAAAPPLHPQALTSLLQTLTAQNYLPVLIFDQFEEFFFVQDQPQQRHPFYEFLRDCLNLDHVKIILALREDYLHYLLEFQRLARSENINLDDIEDILGKAVRYPLGDFSRADARAVITSLTEQSQFYLDEDLIDELVRNLAQETGEVRPIELQVVGAELQEEGISTLEEYYQKGPKEILVQRSLETVVHDCGATNELVARTVLFSLTNESGTRPLKIREDLESDLVDLGLTHEIAKLDLVLEVLIGSGLVFQSPDNPADYYQLVHDYLVSFIRQHCCPQSDEEQDRERELRRMTEEELEQAYLKEKQARQQAEVAAITALNQASEVALGGQHDLAALLSSIKAAQKLRHLESNCTSTDLIRLTLGQLWRSLYTIQPETLPNGEADEIWRVSFDPNDKILTSSQGDGTLIVWSLESEAVEDLNGECYGVLSVDFNPDQKNLLPDREFGEVHLWIVLDQK